ncbi:cupredoxin domain-containing protein [Trinickia fusca]|uniref:EfeO-type cupredoxin-like domain-containing protein n=1 Tax=Trinickia fusca TaxID=2419777 RepID=A0A494X0A6_9BURK|nr:cupredoxin family copper-binding protein [Trinickia fusca]RKP44195.1 hypothetical protein D7S89_23635 [Trinickia fusca]
MTRPHDAWRANALQGVLAVAAAAMPAALWAHTVPVTIEGLQFSPATVTVKRGDTVVWTNKDLVTHTVTADGVFDSHDIEPNHAWTYVAKQPGRYAYRCTLHPTMNGTLVVE